jgi:hypothetical protein
MIVWVLSGLALLVILASIVLLELYDCPTCQPGPSPLGCLPCNGDGRVNLIQKLRWPGSPQPPPSGG